MLGKIGALIGLVLTGTMLIGGTDLANRGDEVRALRAGNGVEVTGTLTGTTERVRYTQRSKRKPGRKIVTHCPEYDYDAGGQRLTYSEQDHCDAGESAGTIELIYDPFAPERAFNNSGADLAQELLWSRVLRVAGGLGALACLAVLWPRGRRSRRGSA